MSAGARAPIIRPGELCIPFRMAFNHASARRSETATLLVQAQDKGGATGIGEGCPRDYVTGETVTSALAFVLRHGQSLQDAVRDLASLEHWMRTHHQDIDANPAAWCALELALLDLLARRQEVSVEALLGLPPVGRTYRYSAVIGAAGTDTFRALLSQYHAAGFGDYKIKLSGDRHQDAANLALLAGATPPPVRLRLDANNLWSDPENAAEYLEELACPAFAVEEPLQPGNLQGMRQLATRLGVKIILDETITRTGQLASLATDPDTWIINLRVSKMGGLLRSLDLLRCCRTLGLPVIVGAQVGETSILTRAALTVASAGRDLVIAQEGAVGTHLLQSDPVSPTLLLGRAGILDVQGMGFSTRAGLGLDLAADAPVHWARA